MNTQNCHAMTKQESLEDFQDNINSTVRLVLLKNYWNGTNQNLEFLEWIMFSEFHHHCSSLVTSILAFLMKQSVIIVFDMKLNKNLD